jgi:hypothetical protein
MRRCRKRPLRNRAARVTSANKPLAVRTQRGLTRSEKMNWRSFEMPIWRGYAERFWTNSGTITRQEIIDRKYEQCS